MRSGPSRSSPHRPNGGADDVHRRRGPLRAHDVPTDRTQRPPAPGRVPRSLEQLRRRSPARDEPRDRPTRIRPRDHALRPREQLRPAVRVGGGDLRPAARDRPRALPRRAGDLDEGRVRHVARPVRRVGLAQVPAREPRPEPPSHGPRLRRHLLLPPLRPGHAARGDDGRAGQRRSPGQGALRRDLVVLAGADARGGVDPRANGHAAAHPPALLLDAEPLDRGRAAGHARRARDRVHRVLTARAGVAHRPLRGRHPGGLPDRPWALPERGSADGPDRWRRSPRSATSPPDEARRCPRWRSPGRFATRE